MKSLSLHEDERLKTNKIDDFIVEIIEYLSENKDLIDDTLVKILENDMAQQHTISYIKELSHKYNENFEGFKQKISEEIIAFKDSLTRIYST
jgi:hypothetical protein